MRWMWIDRVLQLRPRERIVTIKNVSLAEEHLGDHFPACADRPALPLMPASLILEGVAQSAGMLVGHAEGFREKVVLAKISRAELTEDVSPGFTLRYTCDVVQMDRVGAATTARVELIDPAHPAEPRTIGAVDMMFSYADRNMAGIEFPAHNFVFGDAFRTLLRMGGVECPA
ncbi:MAG: beta-hydroxyacyl-ACP dehydratase [Planctomycetota bacterium]|nr:beta-hydroxyacyl-ACP dehydratase [Planctomycetota bacterium]